MASREEAGELRSKSLERSPQGSKDPSETQTSQAVSSEDAAAAEKGPEVVSTTVSTDASTIDGSTATPRASKMAVMPALLAVCALIGLDTNILGAATPQITTEFDSLNDTGWYGSAYLLGILSLQATYRNLYHLLNVKWVYLTAVLITEVGSVVCATARTSTVLIVGRAIAGAGAAGTVSGSLAIIGHLVPLRQRPLYISIITSTFALSTAAAPILGGVFADSSILTWRFCFWINLPIGFLAMLIIMFGYKPSSPASSSLSVTRIIKDLDLVGAVLLISSMVCLLLALQWGGIKYAWSDSRVWGCLLGFGLLFVAFVAVQVSRKERATVSLRVLRQRSVAMSCLYMACISTVNYTLAYYLPFYFQTAKGVSARTSGLRMLAYIVPIFIAATIVGVLTTRTGFYVPFLWVSSTITTIACGLLYTLNSSSSFSHWFGYEIMAGIGYGMGFQVPLTVMQSRLKGGDVLTGNALSLFSQTLAGAVALSIAQNIFSTSLQDALRARGLESLAATTTIAVNDIASNLAPAMLEQFREACGFAVSRVFILTLAAAAAGFLFTLGVEWRKVE